MNTKDSILQSNSFVRELLLNIVIKKSVFPQYSYSKLLDASAKGDSTKKNTQIILEKQTFDKSMKTAPYSFV